MSSPFIASLDIGGTKIAAVVAGPGGPLVRLSEPTIKTGTDRALPEQALALIERACREVGTELFAVRSLGIASCGPFVSIDGMIHLSTPNICGGRAANSGLPNDWMTVPLEPVLRERCGNFVIENDCVAALSAERMFGALQGEDHCAYVTWSTGIGFGLCVDGHILRGKNGNAGHAGHMLMSETDPAMCGCGNRGDVEALCSGRHLSERANMPARDLFEAAHSGELMAAGTVQRAAQWFGRALYNLTTALDMHCFAVGGSVWLHNGVWLLPTVMQELKIRFPELTEGVRIVPAALGGLTADIGALSLVLPDDWCARWQQARPWQNLQSNRV